MANLYGIELSQQATNDEQSTSSDVSSTSGTALTLDQLYLGTISSRHPDTVDTDLYKINVVAGQTYILGYSYNGNVIGWNAQSYDSTDNSNYNFYPKFTLSDTDGTTVTTSYLESFRSGYFYSFTAETTGTLSLLVEPTSTNSNTDQQDYGFFVKTVDTDGMESLLRGAIVGSVFSDDVTLYLTELDALDSHLSKTHLLSGNDQVVVDFQNAKIMYATIYLDEGNDTLSVTNDQKINYEGVLTDSFNGITAYGGTGDDSLSGGRGNDDFRGGSGDDILEGGDGDDSLKGDCYNGDLSYCNYEDSDRSGGVDTINGGAGEDIIVGGVGADLITGGADEDLFVFEVKEDFGDIITDFEVGIDKIALFDALETSDLTSKTFEDVVNLVQSGDDTVVEMSLDATAGSWVTVTTLQNIQASNLNQESFHALKQITASSNLTSSTANLYGIELSQQATNDEQSTSSDVSSTSGTALTLDQLYLGTISSRHPDTVDTDLYKINVVAGQTYILGYSYNGNVIGWNAQSYDSTDNSNYNFYPKFTLSDTDGTTVTTSYLESFRSGYFYSFTAETTGTLSLLVEPTSTNSNTDQQDYGFFVKTVDTDGMESLLRGAIVGSVFSDDVTLYLTELDALDSHLSKTHLLSGNDQVVVDFQNAKIMYATIYLDEGNDTLSVTNDQKINYEGVLTDSFNGITAYGGTGDDSLSGGRGNDDFRGGSGDDILEGGDGDDSLKGDCYNGDLSYCNYEDSDRSGGVDTINGGAGEDIIVGGVGADLITGGADEDLFVFEVKEDFGDIITDFEVGIDKIALFDALETSDLTSKTFEDVVNLVQSGDDTVVEMSLDATAGSWVTVTTLQNIQASNLNQESFHALKQITASSNLTSSTANLYGIELSQQATNDEQSTSSDVSSTSGTALTLDQLYLGTISSRHPDTVDTDLYKINVVAGQTYILGYSYNGNVIGWNAQSYDSTDNSNYNFYPKFTLSDTDGTTVTTSYLESFRSGYFYSFTAETTGTLSLLVEPTSTNSNTDQQDYGFFVKTVDTDGMESLLRGAIVGSVFSDDVTLYLTELDALDSHLSKTHLLSGNDQVVVDFQNAKIMYATIYLDEGNDTLSVTNDQKINYEGVLTDSFNGITAYGGTGDDSLSGGRGNDDFRGGSGDDILEGGDGDDSLKGDCYNGDLSYCNYEDSDRSGGVDTINGGAGEDIIVGGVGADLITGGADEDLFVFEVKEDFGDIITDFEVGIDKIALFDALETSDLTSKTFEDVVNLVQSGDDTVVEMSLDATAGSWVTVTTLQNIQASNLNQESFHGLDKIGTIIDPIVDAGSKPISLAKMVASEFIFTGMNGVLSKGKVADLAPNNTLIHSAELEETTDGAVDISDVITQLRHIVGLYELTGLHKAAADNDTNGTIEISDVISSLRQIVGLQDAPNARIVDAEGNHQFMFDQRVADLYLVAPGDADLSWNPLNLI